MIRHEMINATDLMISLPALIFLAKLPASCLRVFFGLQCQNLEENYLQWSESVLNIRIGVEIGMFSLKSSQLVGLTTPYFIYPGISSGICSQTVMWSKTRPKPDNHLCVIYPLRHALIPSLSGLSD